MEWHERKQSQSKCRYWKETGRTEENNKKYKSGLSVPDLSGHLMPPFSGWLNLVQEYAEVIWRKECVGYMRMWQEIWPIRAIGGGRSIRCELFHTSDWPDFLPNSHTTNTLLSFLPNCFSIYLNQIQSHCRWTQYVPQKMLENTSTTQCRNPKDHQPEKVILAYY
jgi:hypothetical protein